MRKAQNREGGKRRRLGLSKRMGNANDDQIEEAGYFLASQVGGRNWNSIFWKLVGLRELVPMTKDNFPQDQLS